MAIETTIEDFADFFVGEDKQIVYTILGSDGVTPEDITGWALEWVVRVKDTDTSTAVLSKTTAAGGIVISGTYDADPAVNTQVATVTIADTDTVSLTPRTYRKALRRTDDGFETVLAFGPLPIRGVTAR